MPGLASEKAPFWVAARVSDGEKDLPDAHIHVLDASHFVLDTKADEIAALARGFMGRK
jgi:hypothetical protein